MSFSSKTKSSLCTPPLPLCCRRAELAGMLVFSNECTEDRIKLVTENKDVAELYMHFLKELCSVKANLCVTEKEAIKNDDGSIRRKESRKYKITVTGKREIVHLHSLFVTELASRYHINQKLFKCKSCRKSFVRGAFLAAGTVSNPENSYHCEISTSHKALCREMLEVLEYMGLEPKTVERGSNTVMYYKGSERIVDFLQVIGASNAAFEMLNSKIKKDIINNTNRIINCETANISKSVCATREALEAIDYLEKNGKLDTLPERLKQVATLRRENPEATLAELSGMTDPPLSKSGLNHRLRKIIEIRNKSDG